MQLPAATIRLSPTTGLNLYNDCQRCFWLQYRENITRPRGIFPSLPGGMDGVIKKYFDRFRGGLPPELDGKVEGTLIADQALLNRWRNWKTGLDYRDSARNAVLFGALDDCLVNASAQHVPLDYKTRGSAPRPGDSERYYQTQLDTYALLLASNGYPAADYGYLVYYYPESAGEHGSVKFSVQPVRLLVDRTRVQQLFESAVDLLAGPAPAMSRNCAYCSWFAKRSSVHTGAGPPAD